MAIVFVGLLLLVVGGTGGIAIGGTGYGALLGIIIALLSGIFFQISCTRIRKNSSNLKGRVEVENKDDDLGGGCH